MRTNVELNEFTKGEDMTNFIRSRRIKWKGCIQRKVKLWQTKKIDWCPMVFVEDQGRVGRLM